MDIKSSLDFDCYSKAAGIKDKILLERVKDSITFPIVIIDKLVNSPIHQLNNRL